MNNWHWCECCGRFISKEPTNQRLCTKCSLYIKDVRAKLAARKFNEITKLNKEIVRLSLNQKK